MSIQHKIYKIRVGPVYDILENEIRKIKVAPIRARTFLHNSIWSIKYIFCSDISSNHLVLLFLSNTKC